ncbi:MAG: S8 family serine peptidase [Phaeodactylibacter sp.]|nr:S8 family serine peptidase [Phaeodactylibacter sp.]MCB9292668.1 S8 family serine peptidase [Lewinellaceae bacterium]
MKIRFLEDTYIRSTPHTRLGTPIGTVFKGTEIEVEPTPVEGEAIDDINLWFRDKKGWHYWSGRAVVVELPGPPAEKEEKGPAESPAAPARAGQEEELPPPPSIPAFIDRKTEPANEKIPEGETRHVPGLEELMQAEARFQGGLETGGGQPKSPFGALSRSFVPGPENIDAGGSGGALWRDPPGERLNWAVRNYQIASDWWQARQLAGSGVRIALLSTGAATGHPDLPHIEAAFQYPDDSKPMQDLQGLGTQAAVVAAGAGQAVFGVAPEARLLIGKIGEQDHLITPEGLLAGLEWAISARADIIAMLVDFPGLPDQQMEALQQLIGQAAARNIILVAPVGTAANKMPESRYPARLDHVLSVGAHDQFGQRCSFSARSYHLDLLAPGEGLTVSASAGQVKENVKSVAIAAAFTAGFMALIRQQSRDMAPEAVFELLRETAVSRRPFNKGEDVECGYGQLNPIEVLKKLDPSYEG